MNTIGVYLRESLSTRKSSLFLHGSSSTEKKAPTTRSMDVSGRNESEVVGRWRGGTNESELGEDGAVRVRICR